MFVVVDPKILVLSRPNGFVCRCLLHTLYTLAYTLGVKIYISSDRGSFKKEPNYNLQVKYSYAEADGVFNGCMNPGLNGCMNQLNLAVYFGLLKTS